MNFNGIVKRILPLLIMLTGSGLSGNAQPKTDAVYSDVIKIEDKDVVWRAPFYLIDIAVNRYAEPPVFYNEAGIPAHLFKTAWPELPLFRVISPGLKDSRTIHTIYTIKRSLDGSRRVSVDSLQLPGKPVIHFRNGDAGDQKLVKAWLTEHRGSVCCPRDPAWDNDNNLSGFIRQYEEQRGVKIEGLYTRSEGREGEHTSHYTLSNLSLRQKLNFIVQYRDYAYRKESGKQMLHAPRVFTPYGQDIEGFELSTY